MAKRDIVIADLPNAGMCNLLLVWAKAYIFARLNASPLYVHGWNHFRIGPWLRKERTKRFYGLYFKALTNYFNLKLVSKLKQKQIVIEPSLAKIPEGQGHQYFLFNKIPSRQDYFKDLRNNRTWVVEGFYEMIRDKYKSQLNRLAPPVIGVHIRRGDFKVEKLFTSNSYFIDTINQLRSHLGKDLPVTIFTDGYSNEITELLDLPNVELFQSQNDLIDLLQLSRSKIIIPTPRSTFSLWAGFISESDIILPENYDNGRIRQKEDPYFEGSLTTYLNKENATSGITK